jgi:hypothetical protein
MTTNSIPSERFAMKKLTLSLLVLALVAAFIAPSGLAAAKGKKKPAGPLVVGTDPAGDWGTNVDPTIGPAGDALGQDLVEASIAMADAKTVNFIFKVNALPPSGGVPEVSRYNWDFNVNGEAFQLSGAFTEYARGVCNPNMTNGCPAGGATPRDPGSAPFFIRQGSCLVGEECFDRGLFHGTFDSATGTITVPIPLEVIKAKPGSKIGPSPSSLGMSIYAAPAAFVSNAALPHDQLLVSGTFVVPKGK